MSGCECWTVRYHFHNGLIGGAVHDHGTAYFGVLCRLRQPTLGLLDVTFFTFYLSLFTFTPLLCELLACDGSIMAFGGTGLY